MNIYIKNRLYCFIFLLFPVIFIIGSEKPTIWPHIENESTAIKRSDIFLWLTGMQEKTFVTSLNEIMPQLPEATQKLMNGMKHSYPTVGDLRESVKHKLSPDNKGTFSIIVVDVAKDSDNRDKIDIGSLQAANPDAVFQTASRPNGLEGGQIIYAANKTNFNVQNNGFTAILGASAVQGEEAQISAAIKGIYEIYCTTENINFFDKIGIDVDSYGNIQKLSDEKIKELEDVSDIASLSDQIKVGHWENVPVTTGYANIIYQSAEIKKSNTFNREVRKSNNLDANMLVTKPCFISQVNATAVDMNTQRMALEVFNNNKQAAENLAKAALRAAYEGTLYCALAENKKKVFFTLMGGGSFSNKLTWIAETLQNLQSIIQHSGLDVTLAALEINGHLENQDNQEAWQIITNMVTQTGGTFTRPEQKTNESNTPEPKIMIPVPISQNNPLTQKLTNAMTTNTFRNWMIAAGVSILALLGLKYYFQSKKAE